MWKTGSRHSRFSDTLRVVGVSTIALLLVVPTAVGQNLPAPKQTALEWIESNEQELVSVSHDIWEYSEVGLKETLSMARLTELLLANGFEVEDGIAGMPTAFIGSYGSGEPIIGFLAEYDALPGVSQDAVPERQPRPGVDAGHGCGHNLYSTASTAAAIAVKQAMEKHGLPGTVRLFGTPAEETLIGKIYMSRAGVFEDLDAVFSWHPGDRTGASYGYSKALASAKFRFRGLTAHASTSPHEGRSALDAVEAMNFGVNLLREHVKEDARMHYVITDGGGQPNVVPAYAEVWYYVRANKHLDVETYFDRVVEIAEGAAKMTQTELEVEVITATHEILPNRTLAEIVDSNLNIVGAPSFTAEEKVFATKIQEPLGRTFDVALSEKIEPLPSEPSQGVASNDQGDISWFTPVGRMRSACYPVGTPGHSWQIVASGGTTIGQKGMLVAAKTLALSGVQLLSSPNAVEAANQELDTIRETLPFKSLVPEGQQAPKAIR